MDDSVSDSVRDSVGDGARDGDVGVRTPGASVKVRVCLPAHPEAPRSEYLWAGYAGPLDDPGTAGGHYEVHNNAFFCPLLVQDIVRAELSGDSELQVTAVVRGGGRQGFTVRCPLDRVVEFCRLADEWARTGAWTEGDGHGVFVVSTCVSAAARPDLAELARLAADGLVLHWRRHRPPGASVAEIERGCDLRLRTTPEFQPGHTTTYWAGSDPYWDEHGPEDPEQRAAFLAYLQDLARRDVQVARALERGKHHQVLRMIELMGMPPSMWPADERIFDPEDTEGEL